LASNSVGWPISCTSPASITTTKSLRITLSSLQAAAQGREAGRGQNREAQWLLFATKHCTAVY
jgi:hypothetical protein